jgi:hypothetical protein
MFIFLGLDILIIVFFINQQFHSNKNVFIWSWSKFLSRVHLDYYQTHAHYHVNYINVITNAKCWIFQLFSLFDDWIIFLLCLFRVDDWSWNLYTYLVVVLWLIPKNRFEFSELYKNITSIFIKLIIFIKRINR